MRGVYFTILPASPCAAEFYEIWHTRSAHRRNHVCQIFSRSVQGLRSSDTPKIAISHWLAASPLQQCGTTVRHCDAIQTLTFRNCICASVLYKLQLPKVADGASSWVRQTQTVENFILWINIINSLITSGVLHPGCHAHP